MSKEGNAYAPPTTPCEGQQKKNPFSITLVELLVIMAIIGILVALLLPAVRLGPNRSARRMSCRNNIKQILLALTNYHDTHGTLPPAYIADEDGKPLHSWRVLILPFMEEKRLYEQYRFDEPWDSKHNLDVAKRMPLPYQCPSATIPEQGIPRTTYVVVTDQAGLFYQDRTTSTKNLDDAANTIMVAEVIDEDAIIWTQPTDIDMYALQQLVALGDDDQSTHGFGTHVGFADASVRSIANTLTDGQIAELIATEKTTE